MKHYRNNYRFSKKYYKNRANLIANFFRLFAKQQYTNPPINASINNITAINFPFKSVSFIYDTNSLNSQI